MAVVERSSVRTDQRVNRGRAAGLVSRARQAADHHRNRRLDRGLRRRRIDAELLADLLNLLRAKMLMN